MEKKRSVGVTIIACWFFLQTLMGVGYINEHGMLMVVFTVISLAIGIGLWKLLNSARIGVLLFFGISSLYSLLVIVNLLTQHTLEEFFEYPITVALLAGFIFTTIMFLLLLLFFTRPKVKEQFKGK